MTKDLDLKLSERTDGLDGSAGDMYRFISEVVALASQTDRAHSAPVLELQFGDMLTRTSIRIRNGVHCLMIVVVLPYLKDAAAWQEVVPLSAIFPSDVNEPEILWHADEGRYVVVRHLPVADFSDEPSVLDAILDSVDHVSAWLSGNDDRHLRTVAAADR